MTQLEPRSAPSGISLPLLLRKKSNTQTEVKTPSKSIGKRVFSADAIEDRAKRTALAMIEIQKQVYSGEETYYDDTNSHGNLFRGWDAFAFVDAKDIGSSSSAPQPTNRRVPADSRWFSSSCGSVQRSGKTSLLSPKGAPPTVVRSETALPTSASVASASGAER